MTASYTRTGLWYRRGEAARTSCVQHQRIGPFQRLTHIARASQKLVTRTGAKNCRLDCGWCNDFNRTAHLQPFLKTTIQNPRIPMPKEPCKPPSTTGAHASAAVIEHDRRVLTHTQFPHQAGKACCARYRMRERTLRISEDVDIESPRTRKVLRDKCGIGIALLPWQKHAGIKGNEPADLGDQGRGINKWRDRHDHTIGRGMRPAPERANVSFNEHAAHTVMPSMSFVSF